jgi:lipopolysaccharide transport system ATP-binding protein
MIIASSNLQTVNPGNSEPSQGVDNSDVVINIQNVSKYYQIYPSPMARIKELFHPFGKLYHRKFEALKNVSFTIRRGQTLGIIGRNGSGKSTLLQLICGILKPTEGDIFVKGRVAALLELGAGFNPEFTGRENIYMNAALIGLSKQQIDERFDDIASFADIGDFIEQPVKTYSSGMYMRLAFSSMIHVDADILVIDEALAVGDIFFVQKCMRFLNSFQEKGTILFVSHSRDVVLSLCKYAVWLDHGELKAEGEPNQVCQAYADAFFQDLTEKRQPLATESSELEAKTDSQNEPQHPSDTVEPPKYDRTILVDQRRDFINHSSLRNDIEVFSFNPNAPSYCNNVGKIIDLSLQTQEGGILTWVVGGEIVALAVRAKALQHIYNPHLGFIIKNRLGQYLFGDNTMIAYEKNPLSMEKGELIEARFVFQMPYLPISDYTITVAFAEGTQDDYFIHHNINDALKFEAHSSLHTGCLLGIPMLEIGMKKL